jgi:hypothetical protein
MVDVMYTASTLIYLSGVGLLCIHNYNILSILSLSIIYPLHVQYNVRYSLIKKEN